VLVLQSDSGQLPRAPGPGTAGPARGECAAPSHQRGLRCGPAFSSAGARRWEAAEAAANCTGAPKPLGAEALGLGEAPGAEQVKCPDILLAKYGSAPSGKGGEKWGAATPAASRVEVCQTQRCQAGSTRAADSGREMASRIPWLLWGRHWGFPTLHRRPEG